VHKVFPQDAEVARIMAKGANRERLVFEGVEPVMGASADFAALLRNEISKWGKVGKEIGLKLD
jgi:tripartite-type tricarboxylate transporter receptor subunit TctC